MNEAVESYLQSRIAEFSIIPEERKVILGNIANYVSSKIEKSEQVNLIFICTHNSRRSHFGQIWAAVAADFYYVQNVHTYSGGTEATAFHPNAIESLRRSGLIVQKNSEESNAKYEVSYSSERSPLICFSKVYDDPTNPQSHFAAIMTCSDAEENCPFIPGVELRIGTTYDDPKVSDNTSRQDQTYDERCRQIAREMCYVFSLVSIHR